MHCSKVEEIQGCSGCYPSTRIHALMRCVQLGSIPGQSPQVRTAMLWSRYPTDFKNVFPVFLDDQVHVRDSQSCTRMGPRKIGVELLNL